MNQLIEVKRYLKIKSGALSILQDQIPREVTSVPAAPTAPLGSDPSRRDRTHPPPRHFIKLLRPNSKITTFRAPNYKLRHFQCNLQMPRVIITPHLVRKKKKSHFIILWQLNALNISNPAREILCLEQV